jgi:hypothetical protein
MPRAAGLSERVLGDRGPGAAGAVIDFLARVVDPAAGRKVVVPGCGARGLARGGSRGGVPDLGDLGDGLHRSGAGGRGALPRVRFADRDIRELGLGPEFDVAVVTNSVLSDSDVDF